MFRFQANRNINKSILQQKWPKINTDIEDDPYEMLVFAYNKEMDQLMLTNSFTTSEGEEFKSPTCPKQGMIEIDDEEETTIMITTCPKNVMTNSNDKEKTTLRRTLRFKVGSNQYEQE